jgi:hypothetical protein
MTILILGYLGWFALLGSACAACCGGPLEFVEISDMVVLLYTYDIHIARPQGTEYAKFTYIIEYFSQIKNTSLKYTIFMPVDAQARSASLRCVN